MEVALYKVEEWEPPADWVDRGRRVGSSLRVAPANEEVGDGEGGGREHRRRRKRWLRRRTRLNGWQREEPEGFMNPRCGGLDRLCRISVFEEDGNGLQITAKVAPAARLD